VARFSLLDYKPGSYPVIASEPVIDILSNVINTAIRYRDEGLLVSDPNNFLNCVVEYLKQKPLRGIEGIIYMDGLVSTGNKISFHNIKYNFHYQKNFLIKFYSHFK
jgi:hypothetical protein